MAETLLTNSSIKMYGRLLNDLVYIDDTAPSAIGANNFLQRQLAGGSFLVIGNTTGAPPSATVSAIATTAGIAVGMMVSSGGVFAQGTTIVAVTPTTFNVNPIPLVAAPNITISISIQTYFARIYAFTFEGAIYSLPKPSIFLVHGQGAKVDGANRSTMEMSGVAAREWEFSKWVATGDLSYWEYEKGDFSLRLDSEAGPLEQILLAAAVRGADMADRSGANLGVRSGANLSGANLSGANLSGANLSGANLSGANLRNR